MKQQLQANAVALMRGGLEAGGIAEQLVLLLLPRELAKVACSVGILCPWRDETSFVFFVVHGMMGSGLSTWHEGIGFKHMA